MPFLNKNIKRPWIKESEGNQATKKTDPFYKSNQWRKIRLIKLRINPLCEQCEAKGIVREGKEIDHIKRLKEGGEPFDLENLQTLCKSCHAKKRAKERHQTGGGMVS